MKKISIIGSGQVGQATAQMLARENYCSEIALVGRSKGIPEGAALDIQHAIPLYESNTVIKGYHDNKAIQDSDVVVITSGMSRKPGMSREDLLDSNIPIIRQIVEDILQYAPNAFVIMVTNPVDVLTYYAWSLTTWDKARIMGLSCILDSARMASLIALKTGYSPKEVSALVIGGHGDKMVPLPRFSSINGVPLDVFLEPIEIAEIIELTRSAGGEIVSLKGASGYVAASAGIVNMLDALINDRNHILPCVSIIESEYNFSDIALGVPSVLGGKGVSKIIELPLNNEEMRMLASSADEVKEIIDSIRSE